MQEKEVNDWGDGIEDNTINPVIIEKIEDITTEEFNHIKAEMDSWYFNIEEDLKFFEEKLYKALGVPRKYLLPLK